VNFWNNVLAETVQEKPLTMQF